MTLCCDKTFQALNFFFSGERNVFTNEIPGLLQPPLQSSKVSDVIEWDLKQDYTDIMFLDFTSIIRRFTPSFIKKLGKQVYRHCYISLQEEDYFNINPNVNQLFILNQLNYKIKKYFVDAHQIMLPGKCYFAFIRHLNQMMATVNVLLQKVIFNRISDMSREVPDTFRISSNYQKVVHSAWSGPFKLILTFIFHKRF